MLAFYKEQLQKQEILKIFLDIYPEENNKSLQTVFNLVEGQLERLNKLIDPMNHPLEDPSALLKNYQQVYNEQRLYLAAAIGKDAIDSHLPTLTLPEKKIENFQPYNPFTEPTSSARLTQPGSYSSTFFVPLSAGSSPEEGSPVEGILARLESDNLTQQSSSRKRKQENKLGLTDKHEAEKLRLETLEQKSKETKLTSEESKERRRLKNLFSASESRKRQKDKLSSLAVRNKKLESENQDLREEVLRLQAENRRLQEDLKSKSLGYGGFWQAPSASEDSPQSVFLDSIFPCF
ncbi:MULTISPECIES: hypothetical protein [unclassified Legionella]|uniref:hypothetical protein n=1 Tax=unclassified Legionella TaxID=2622702 RepID=UPI0010545677|nr:MULTISPECIES: hypothetical protein [unclassified Legionella]MDI9817610.1 hypothetical protein [Legionella sp. PL877]